MGKNANRAALRWLEEVFSGSPSEKPEILKGVRVVEMATRIFGPYTGDLLAQLGAEVIKIEMPGAGDLMRYVTPEGYFWKNASVGFFPQNRNKYHVGLDLHYEEGKEIFRELVRRSDVVLENLKAGTMDRWGLGYLQLREINPKIIYAANTGFGQWGPFSLGRPSYDATAQAVSGMSEITGFPGRPPLKVGIYIGDFTGALTSAFAILVALYHREKTGKGQFIDVAQAEVLIRILDWTWAYTSLKGKPRTRVGNMDPAVPPSGVFRCRDGFVALSAVTPEQWRGFVSALGDLVPEEIRLLEDPLERTKGEIPEALDEITGKWCSSMKVEEVLSAAQKGGFVAVKVQNARDHYESGHLRARKSVWEVEDELYGTVTEYGPPPKFSDSPMRLKWEAKPVGYHNEFVFKEILGLGQEEMARLEEKGVIGRWDDRPGACPPEKS
ncbi:MAG: CoA transferase [Deltaproteobacteria bacterium]|nr:MAG: CoA transferase [Deltaproteobacteria bacterium]